MDAPLTLLSLAVAAFFHGCYVAWLFEHVDVESRGADRGGWVALGSFAMSGALLLCALGAWLAEVSP